MFNQPIPLHVLIILSIMFIVSCGVFYYMLRYWKKETTDIQYSGEPTSQDQPIQIGFAVGEPAPRLDTNSPTWIFIRDWAEERIVKLRKQNDSILLTEAQSNSLRGGIMEMKKLLDIPNPKRRTSAAKTIRQ